MNNNQTAKGPSFREEVAVEHMQHALTALRESSPSRERSVAITQLETALMWANKDRTIKGQLFANPTHV